MPLTPPAGSSRQNVWLVLTVLIALFTGCKQSDQVTISGKVTIGGVPVADGMISFEPADKLGPTAGALVRDGSYSLSLRPGAKLVRVDGYKIVGERPFNAADPKTKMIPIKESILPPESRQEPLACEISPAGGNFDFAVPGESQ